MHELLRAFGRRQLKAPRSFHDALAALVPQQFHAP
jgi:hypothetical protein